MDTLELRVCGQCDKCGEVFRAQVVIARDGGPFAVAADVAKAHVEKNFAQLDKARAEHDCPGTWEETLKPMKEKSAQAREQGESDGQ